MLDDFEIDYPEDEDFLDEEDGDSGPDRKMLIIGGALALGIIGVIACLAIYFLVIRPQADPQAQTATAAAIVATQSRAETEAAIASIPAATYTPLPTEIPTNTPTATQVPETEGPTETAEGGPTADPRTATVRALLTQAAQAQTQQAEAILTVTATPTSTALPDTGFADDVGIPTLLGMTALLIMVIFVARRLREATA
jgi:LPXTG-motif cell wall-anchored protein